MAHVALIDENNIVQAIHVINNHDLPNDGEFSPEVEKAANEFQHALGHLGTWKLASRNDNFRGRYPRIGDIYDSKKDRFIQIINMQTSEGFLLQGINEVNKLRDLAGLNKNSRLLDLGCGKSRVGFGIKYSFTTERIADYHGVDIQEHPIKWAQDHLDEPGFRFTFVNLYHPHYNPNGERKNTIPAEDNSVDIVCAYSVFSHMSDSDASEYLKLINKVLVENGKAYITAYVEENVPDWEENPYGYGMQGLDWPLGRSRFSKSNFEKHVADSGMEIEEFIYGKEVDGQSLYILKKI